MNGNLDRHWLCVNMTSATKETDQKEIESLIPVRFLTVSHIHHA